MGDYLAEKGMIEAGKRRIEKEKTMSDEMPTFCTMRDGDDEIHLECRFPNGEKYAAVTICDSKIELANFLNNAINTRADDQAEKDRVMEVMAEALADIASVTLADANTDAFKWVGNCQARAASAIEQSRKLGDE